MAEITEILGSQCIGDSREIINQNFASLNNFAITVTTTAALGSSSNAINTTNKVQGKIVYNSTDKKLYVSDGASPTSLWYVADASTSITPGS